MKHLLKRLKSKNLNQLYIALNATCKAINGRNALILAVCQSIISCSTIENEGKNIESYVANLSKDVEYRMKIQKIELLVKEMNRTGANINLEDDLGNTALIYAAAHFNSDIINLLLAINDTKLSLNELELESKTNKDENKNKLNFGVTNDIGQNALIVACLMGSKGSKLNRNGRTMRNLAIEKIQLLVENDENIRQNVNIANNNKETALSIVQKCGLTKSVKLIKSHMFQQVGK